MKSHNLNRDKIFISTDKNKLDAGYIHGFLTEAYWAKGRTKETVNRCIEKSFCFGMYYKEKQIGFARVITDFTIMAYLADVFIDKDYRGNGLAKGLISTAIDHPELKTIRKWFLVTNDAQGFYEKLGFKGLSRPDKMMELVRVQTAG